MRWLQTEYVLKGIYLGFLLFTALEVGRQGQPDARPIGQFVLATLAGLAVCLAVAAAQKLREGYRVHGKVLPFLLFLLLESPGLVYTGVLVGTAAGAFWVARTTNPDGENSLLVSTVAGGAVLGLLYNILHGVPDRRVRLGLSLALGAVIVLGILYWFGQLPEYAPAQPLVLRQMTLFAAQLLAGVPFFYLLTFTGHEEESEIEIGGLCALLGLGLGTLLREQMGWGALGFYIPILLFFWYTMRVLPHLKVFKHALRGHSYARIGRIPQAIRSFRRALALNPRYPLAREGMWAVHRGLDVEHLAQDPEIRDLIDFDLCVDRAGSLLLQQPTPERLDEANRLLNLAVNLRPELTPVARYWRAVAHAHRKEFDQAAAELTAVLDPAASPDSAPRRSVLLAAWQLALRLHPEVYKRVGSRQITLPGRRVEAIAAVERRLAENPDDGEAWNLKRLLYQDLTEAEYEAAAPGAALADLDHAYAQQLGLNLLNDEARWRRGCEYLRVAARGLPALGPTLFTQMAQAHQRAGNAEGVRQNYELAKRAGKAHGPKNLGAEDRDAYFAAVKLLGESAVAREEWREALDNYILYTENERSGVETYRTLASLFEKVGDPLSALRAADHALVYNGSDKDLLDKKDRYYYSVTPEQLRAKLDVVKSGFDVAYCVRKARGLLEGKVVDLDLLDWAHHLIELVRVIQPENLTAKVLAARALLRRGERDAAFALLEEAYTKKPEKFASGEDEESWYLAARLLGDLYLQELNKPDLAVQCFNDFRHSTKSGADTLYKLGQAYEQLGDRPRAAKCYEQVTAYDSHPLAPDAREALYRVQSAAP